VSLLEAKSVAFGYGPCEVLDGVSLSIREGDFLGVIGPNGAGKSTLLKLLTRAASPDRGSVEFLGRNLSEYSVKEIARLMAVLPAEMHFSYDFTVREVVKMGRAPYLPFWSEGTEKDLEIVHRAIAASGIEALADRSVRTLSSGERQMAFLAQAMAQQPRILLLDEPTVHLDIRHQVEIFRILEQWNEGGLTVAVILHDLNVAARFCKRLVLMRQGRILRDGPPKEVLTEENLTQLYGIPMKVLPGSGSGAPAVLFD
jgi:iron complex transport system ATP-binding protein